MSQLLPGVSTLVWFGYTTFLNHLERRLARRKGMCEDMEIIVRLHRFVLILLGYAVLENVGYRQLTLYWRLRGLWDAWRGKTGWEKFARVGLREGVAPAHG